MGYNEAKFLNRKRIIHDDGIRLIGLFSYRVINNIISSSDHHFVRI